MFRRNCHPQGADTNVVETYSNITGLQRSRRSHVKLRRNMWKQINSKIHNI